MESIPEGGNQTVFYLMLFRISRLARSHSCISCALL
jgi:hypothetical protein